VSLIQVPDLFKAEGLGIGCLPQHARIAHAGKMAAGHLLYAQKLGVKQYDLCVLGPAVASPDLRPELGNEIVGKVFAQLVDVAAVPDTLDGDELLLGVGQEGGRIKTLPTEPAVL